MTEAAVAASPKFEAARPVFRLPLIAWILLVAALAAAILAVKTGLLQMFGWLLDRPEYSHGIIIPFVAAFLVWQRRDQIERLPFVGSWAGLVVVLVGAALG